MEDSDDEIIAAKPKKAGPAKKPAAAAAAKKPSPAAGKPKPSRDVAFADGGLGELGWRSGLLLLAPYGVCCEEAATQWLERPAEAGCIAGKHITAQPSRPNRLACRGQ